jgi:hypothetical protein
MVLPIASSITDNTPEPWENVAVVAISHDPSKGLSPSIGCLAASRTEDLKPGFRPP